MAACGVEFSLKAGGNFRTGWLVQGPTRMWWAHCGAALRCLTAFQGLGLYNDWRQWVAGLIRLQPPLLVL